MFAAPPVIQAEVFARVPDALRAKGSAIRKQSHIPRDCFLEGPSFDRAGNLWVVNIPYGQIMKITPQGAEDLRVDRDGDGNFEATIRPTAAVRGPAARDISGPVIKFSAAALSPDTLLLTIHAEDPSGVSDLRYSLDGSNFPHYAGPFRVDASRVREVQAFADDRLGNRSGVYTYKPGRRPGED